MLQDLPVNAYRATKDDVVRAHRDVPDRRAVRLRRREGRHGDARRSSTTGSAALRADGRFDEIYGTYFEGVGSSPHRRQRGPPRSGGRSTGHPRAAGVAGGHADWARLRRAFLDGDIFWDQFPEIVTRAGAQHADLHGARVRARARRSRSCWRSCGCRRCARTVGSRPRGSRCSAACRPSLTIFAVGYAMPIALDVRVPGTYGPGGGRPSASSTPRTWPRRSGRASRPSRAARWRRPARWACRAPAGDGVDRAAAGDAHRRAAADQRARGPDQGHVAACSCSGTTAGHDRDHQVLARRGRPDLQHHAARRRRLVYLAITIPLTAAGRPCWSGGTGVPADAATRGARDRARRPAQALRRPRGAARACR